MRIVLVHEPREDVIDVGRVDGLNHPARRRREFLNLLVRERTVFRKFVVNGSDLGVSQEFLGELSGLHRTYISSVERGERNVSLVNIHVLARALAVSPCALVEDGR